MSSQKYRVPYYSIKKEISNGAFGTVFIGTKRKVRKTASKKLRTHMANLPKKAAIKIIDTELLYKNTKLLTGKSRKRIVKTVKLEAKLHMRLNHTNIVKLYKYGRIRHTKVWYMILEYVDGDTLYDYLNSKDTPDTEVQNKVYFKQILDAIAYCHDMGVVHRDVKLENIMITRDRQKIVLLDFGLSVTPSGSGLCKTKCGSIGYAAPELYMNNSPLYKGAMVDVFALGVVLYAMCFLKLPFCNGFGSIDIPSTVSANLYRLIMDMLSYSPIYRISIREIYQRYWISKSADEWCPYKCIKGCEHSPRRNSWIRRSNINISEYADSPRFSGIKAKCDPCLESIKDHVFKKK